MFLLVMVVETTSTVGPSKSSEYSTGNRMLYLKKKNDESETSDSSDFDLVIITLFGSVPCRRRVIVEYSPVLSAMLADEANDDDDKEDVLSPRLEHDAVSIVETSDKATKLDLRLRGVPFGGLRKIVELIHKGQTSINLYNFYECFFVASALSICGVVALIAQWLVDESAISLNSL